MAATGRWHYDQHIKPLIENALRRVLGGSEFDTCSDNGIIDDESLQTACELDDFACQHCRYDRAKHEES